MAFIRNLHTGGFDRCGAMNPSTGAAKRLPPRGTGASTAYAAALLNARWPVRQGAAGSLAGCQVGLSTSLKNEASRLVAESKRGAPILGRVDH